MSYKYIIFFISVFFLTSSCKKSSERYDFVDKTDTEASIVEHKLLLSDSLMQLGQYEQAIPHLDTLELFSQKLDTSAYIKSLFRLGTSYSNLGSYAKSLFYFMNGEKIAMHFGDSIKTMKFKANIAILYSKVKEDDKAFKIFKDIIETYKELKNRKGQPINLSPVKNSLAIIYKERHSLDTALTLFNEAKNEEQESLLKAGIYNNIGSIYRLKENYELAHNYTDTAISIAHQNHRKDYLVYFFSSKAKIFSQQQSASNAALYLDSIKTIYSSSFNWLAWKNYMEVQIDYYTLIADYKKALELSQSYNKKEFKEQQTIRNKQFYNALIINESQQKQDEIKDLQNQQLVSKLRLKHLYIVLSIILLAMIILFLLLIQIYKRHKKISQLNKGLVKKNLELLERDKQNIQKSVKKETKSTDINKDLKASLIKQLEDLDNNTELLCTQDLSIDKLARLFNTNQKYLSQIINEAYQCNFNNFINEKRIKESCRLFMNRDYDNYTIEAIATEVGFTNKATFNRAFKKFTQLTPSTFKKHCK
jgi:AraC-like DNA-binding protein